MEGRKYAAASSYRYGFNGKENDNEVKGTGNSLDFGERIYDPRIAKWLAVDRLYRVYPFVSTYNFAFNTPLQAKDPDGERVLWVNGYYNTGKLEGIAGSKSGQAYWSPDFIIEGNSYFNDYNNKFIDGRGKWLSNGTERFEEGYKYAKANYADLINGMKTDSKGNIIESFKIVSHSMGASYAEGITKYLEEQGLQVEQVVHLSPADPSGFKASSKPITTELNYNPDYVLRYKNFGENPVIEGVDNYGVVGTAPGNDPVYNHLYTKSNKDVWKAVADLVGISFGFSYSTTTTISDKYDSECGCQEAITNNFYKASGNLNNTQFLRVEKDGSWYENGNNNIYSGSGGGRKTVPIKKEKTLDDY